ncbi:MAG: hypothetical protein OXE94_04405 [Aestuariivita sp.]|nr:hypothetical protein [Aestuariivita sp.]MCY4202724.1 hypothetical protein [Aestuariivita sp.]
MANSNRSSLRFGRLSGNSKTIISLSTIPPRFSSVGRTLASLLAQKTKADSIELYIPRSYRRFPEHEFCLPEVPDGITVEVVEKDFGPASKVLPCVKKYSGENVQIAYCDDDYIYKDFWLTGLLFSSSNRPDEAVAYVGRDITYSSMFDIPMERLRECASPRVSIRQGGLRNLVKNLPYWVVRQFERYRQEYLKSKTVPKVWKYSCGYADIAEGHGGVLVKPSMFDNRAFAIPPILWSVDDIWLSGSLARTKTKIWVEAPLVRPYCEEERGDSPLATAVLDGTSRKAANRLCVQHFQQEYGVW